MELAFARVIFFVFALRYILEIEINIFCNIDTDQITQLQKELHKSLQNHTNTDSIKLKEEYNQLINRKSILLQKLLDDVITDEEYTSFFIEITLQEKILKQKNNF